MVEVKGLLERGEPSRLTLADFTSLVECRRVTFTLIKRGPKAVEWCSWCREFLKAKDKCPVLTALDSSPTGEARK